VTGEVNRKAITKSWTHSYEEDTDTEIVFRPATYPFPLSRGRQSFELKPGGALLQRGFAPDDRTQRSEGSWRLEGNLLILEPASEGASRRVLRVLHVGPDKLVAAHDKG